MSENEKEKGGLFDDESKSADQNPEPKSFASGRGWKIAIVLALIALIVITIIARPGSRADAPQPQQVFEKDTVLATIDDVEITLGDIDDILSTLPVEVRREYESQKDVVLEELINRELLLQDARAKNISETEEYIEAFADHAPHPGHEEHVLIDVLIWKEVLESVVVTEDELRQVFDLYKDQLPPNVGFEDVKGMLMPSVMQQKQFEAFETYLGSLRDNAVITRNESWIDAQAGDNPLDKAFKAGIPILADFGSESCIPCKMMKPILDRLTEEYRGRIDVMILDTAHYPGLARKHRIRVIPTQIFFDASGKELYRHEGFMSRENILAKFRELEMAENGNR